ncbi:MAG: DNA mismatch repair protein MutS [Clostridiales bacterium]|nr:DNA mismatch repair protein MutS [Clostridiales bacterium]
MATAMMEQYYSVKKNFPDHILFYRIGDFYEMFDEDAHTASRELELVLTGRSNGDEERVPMCGVPFHSCQPYIDKLVSKGYKVAICEQIGEPGETKGPMERRIVRVVTPGTVVDSSALDEKENNYLSTIYFGGEVIAVAFCDIVSNAVYATSFESGDESKLINELSSYSPSEVIANTDETALPRTFAFIEEKLGALVSKNDTMRFDREKCRRISEARFGGSDSLAGAGDEIICAAGALLSYITETQFSDAEYIKELHVYSGGSYLEIDANTRRSLEITETIRGGEKRGSLLWVLDRTKSALGARLLRSWLLHPLTNTSKISDRLDAVSELAENFIMREECARALAGVLDLERLTTKVGFGTANGKDLRAILASLDVIPEIKSILSSASSAQLSGIRENLDEMEDIRELIRASITEEPPFSLREGGIIADGYSEEIDYLRSIMHDGKGWISAMEAQEREKTGIKTLKIGYNKVFGYYIEVSKSYVDQVPSTYIRKQTLVGGERYITDELKNHEATILGAADRLNSLEYDVFVEIRGKVADATPRIRNSASLLSLADVYCSLADVAKRNGYVRPEVDYSDTIDIKDGRHPTVEQFVSDKYFVPNDTLLDTEYNRLMIITGPNMAGKSTYMRQVAQIVIMAQIGSFVPAREARIGIVDKLFTRVGASDDLSSGQSTFMLEMSEVSYILSNATRRSLILYDEIGRGTSTYDGLSIARAVAEYTHSKKIGSRTMFATHYHELTSLENELEGAVNYSIAAKKRGGELVFLRKIVRGGTDDSYGIEVAKLAGVPAEVIKRSRVILKETEDAARRAKENSDASDDGDEVAPVTLPLMLGAEHDAAEKIRAADINTMTPIEAMNLLFELKRLLG